MSYDSDDCDCLECREVYGRTRVPCKWGDCPYDHDPEEMEDSPEDWPI